MFTLEKVTFRTSRSTKFGKNLRPSLTAPKDLTALTLRVSCLHHLMILHIFDFITHGVKRVLDDSLHRIYARKTPCKTLGVDTYFVITTVSSKVDQF